MIRDGDRRGGAGRIRPCTKCNTEHYVQMLLFLLSSRLLTRKKNLLDYDVPGDEMHRCPTISVEKSYPVRVNTRMKRAVFRIASDRPIKTKGGSRNERFTGMCAHDRRFTRNMRKKGRELKERRWRQRLQRERERKRE